MPSHRNISAAFFCPQTQNADEQYLSNLHRFLSRHTHGKTLLRHVADLADDALWQTFASVRDDVRGLTHGPEYLRSLQAWALTGVSGPLSTIRSNITSLPLLAVLQIGQYFRYLKTQKLHHRDFVDGLRAGVGGGVHGYCGGLPAAISVSCARNESEVVQVLAMALKLLVGIGAYTESADSERGAERTLLAVRLKHEGQAEDIIRRFPGAYVSGITAPRSISIGGPSYVIKELERHLTEAMGLHAQPIDLGGSAHNPANISLAEELCRICRKGGLQLPDASRLQTPFRSNQFGQLLLDNASLTDDLIFTMLAAPCQWLNLITNVASDLKNTNIRHHTIGVFGWADCVTMGPFYAEQLRVDKMFAKDCIGSTSLDDVPLKSPSSRQHTSDSTPPVLYHENSIAIVGASCRLPGANNMEELWRLLCQGTNTCRELPSDRLDVSKGCFRLSQAGNSFKDRTLYGNFIDDVKRFDEAFFGISAREAANMDPQQRIALELSFEALEDAGYLSTHTRESADNVGCFIGCVLAEYMDNTNCHAPTAYTSTGTVPAFICGRVSHMYGWSGPSEMINTACSSSMVAINRACKAIQGGECRMALAGGVNVLTGFNNYLDLARAGFLSPTGQCKPFDVSADGYCRADGAGMVVLKKLSEALADGDPIWGVVPGVATNQGGLSASLTTPHPASQQALYREVMRQSGLQADQVTYVEMHGTGTQVGDPLEMESIRSVFGRQDRSQTLHVGSIKANIGHTEPTAGVAGLLKVLVMMHHGSIPPQAGFKSLNPKIPPLELDRMTIDKTMQPWNIGFKAALVNSYGAAGSNGALLCCEPPKGTARCSIQAITGNTVATSIPLFITGKTKQSLWLTANALGSYLDTSNGLQLAQVASRLRRNTQSHGFYATVDARTTKEAATLLQLLEPSNMLPLPTATDQKPLVLVFSGQTSNIIGLPNSLYQSLPCFQYYIDQVDAEFSLASQSQRPLLDILFTPEPIADIAALQCGLFAVQYAAARSWLDSGIVPRAVLGHSLGELTAWAASGVLSLKDSVRLIVGRAKLIETKWGPDKGSMLALEATHDEFKDIKSLIPHIQLDIACFNSPTSLVVSGLSSAIDALQNILKTDVSLQRFRFTRLKTSHGFHSSLVDPILADLAAISSTLVWNTPKIRHVACAEYPLSDGTVAQSPSSHARDPVYFVDAVRRIEAEFGTCTWLEAGFDSPIASMVKKACREPESHTFQAVMTKGQSPAELSISSAVTGLWKSGERQVTHWSVLAVQPAGQVDKRPAVAAAQPGWLPPYQFLRNQHWTSNIDRVLEMKQLTLSNMAVSNTESELPVHQGPPSLVVQRQPQPGQGPNETEFVINTQNPRFQEIVAGHSVCGHPLTPTPMYMECITSALVQMIGPDQDRFKTETLQFDKIEVRSPLGVEPRGQVILRMRQAASRQAWDFKIVCASDGDNSFETQLVEGIISLTEDSPLRGMERLINAQMDRLCSSSGTEVIQSGRLYKLFARVVDYGKFYMGMKNICMKGSEAFANVQIPVDQPHQDQNKAQSVCDAIALDACIHITGFLINTSDIMATHDVSIMVGLEKAIMSPQFGSHMQFQLKVFSSFSSGGENGTLLGDVYVCTKENELIAIFAGVRMQPLPLANLVKILERAFDRSEGKPRTIASRPRIETPATKAQAQGPAATPPVAARQEPGDSAAVKLLKSLISDCTLINVEDIPEKTALGLIGLDSLGASELAEEILSKFNASISAVDLIEMDFKALQKYLIPDAPINQHAHFVPQQSAVDMPTMFIKQSDEPKITSDSDSNTLTPFCGAASDRSLLATEAVLEKDTVVSSIDSGACISQQNPFAILNSLSTDFDKSATMHGAAGYWTEVAPLQDQLTIRYIVEGFATLGVDLRNYSSGVSVPQVPYLSPKYDKLVKRCWETLEKHSIVSTASAKVIRSTGDITARTSSDLLAEFNARFPDYREEATLLGLTGQQLAACLSGKMDSVALMFGSSQSLKIMEDYYARSPISRTVIDQLVIYLIKIVGPIRSRTLGRPVRILEVGGGTGGTTRWLIDGLEKASIETEYTFTDISPSLVRKAKNRFEPQFPWIKYGTFNLESEVDADFRGKFDFVLATNTVHATRDRVASCRRMRETLLPSGGLIALCELTHHISWADICFGLLDGWWLADGPIAPLMTAQEWMSTFSQAGFRSTGYSSGTSPDANTAQVLVGSNVEWHAHLPPVALDLPRGANSAGVNMKTIPYKEEDGVVINADVYFPKPAPASAIPVALMIHGGGFMTLSRRAVRPEQTRYLLGKGVLPISVDYRLCPEVNIIDGPITDVRDAYMWIRNSLPGIAIQYGVKVNIDNIIVVGWSTGGHLAMSLAWTLKELGIPQPRGVLSFYGPVDFEILDKESGGLRHLSKPSRKLEEILAGLPQKPVPNSSSSGETSDLGWIMEGNDRSDLLLRLSQEGLMLPALLNGLTGAAGDRALDTRMPCASRIASISPLSRLRTGDYAVPTCIIHGTADEIAPYAAAQRFHATLEECGVKSTLISLPGEKHVFDLNARPDTVRWDTTIGLGYEFLLDTLV